MTTAVQIAEAIGRKKMADALGVGLTAISNAVVRDWFPSSWFLAVKALADEVGQDCPPELFKMRVPNPLPVDASAQHQALPAKKRRSVA